MFFKYHIITAEGTALSTNSRLSPIPTGGLPLLLKFKCSNVRIFNDEVVYQSIPYMVMTTNVSILMTMQTTMKLSLTLDTSQGVMEDSQEANDKTGRGRNCRIFRWNALLKAHNHLFWRIF